MIILRKPLFTLVLLFLLLAFSSTAFAAGLDQPLKIGMRGNAVVLVQRYLAREGFYAGAFDGIFGPATEQAVCEFQRVYGLPANGIVSGETFAYLERAGGAPSRYRRSLTMIATAYTAYDYGTTGTTYNGHPLRYGLAAVDPRVIPLGTRLYIPGYGYAVADDIGSAIVGNRIDLAFEQIGQALRFGRRRVTVYILD